MSAAPLEVRELSKRFPVGSSLRRRAQVHAVDDVSFELHPGTITALVGESGSGKSTVARLLAQLYAPTEGSVLFEGTDVARVKRRRDVLNYRSQVQIIFQDPFDSLNPVKTVRHHVERPLRIHHVVPRGQVRARALELLDTVGLVPVGGGRGQVPARALRRTAAASCDRPRARGRAAHRPRRRADQHARRLDPHRDPEPDAPAEGRARPHVPVRHARPRERALRRRRHPRHVRRPDRRVGAGGPGAREPLHPYTRLLLSAVPDPAKKLHTERIEIRKAQASAAIDPAEGCRFVTRCPLAVDVCSSVTPLLVEARRGQSARCHVTAPQPATERI